MTGKIKSIAAQYAMITLACALYAVGFNWCFDPNHLSVGGFTGVAQIINFFIPQIPIGVAIIVLNLPLFLLSWTKVGRHWLYATLYATLVSSGMIDLLAGVYTFRPMEPMLAAVYGGVIVGLGCGLMLRYSATTGGTELAARLLKLKLPGLSIGTLCLAIDTIVVVSYAAVFRDLTQALYSMVALFFFSKVMDGVVYGGNGAKMAYIISERYEELTAKLLELVGGKENIAAVSHCMTRMRFVLNDPALANIEAIEAIPSVKGSFTQAGQFQVIIGNTVADFYNDFTAISGIEGVSKDEAKSAAKQNQNALQRIMTALAEIFAPLIPAIITGGLILGFRNVIDSLYIFEGGTATLVQLSQFWAGVDQFLWLIGEAVFHMLPVSICWSLFLFKKH